MRNWIRVGILCLAAIAAFQWWQGRDPAGSPAPTSAATRADANASADGRYPAFLPPEAVATLEAIARGGPFPYSRDGSTFQNRERRLPDAPRGYYREYTVETPGSPDRGARRIVSGGDPAEVFYYTDDHYRSFRRVEVHR
jgi:guanyl-specific ribonuclease Sa